MGLFVGLKVKRCSMNLSLNFPREDTLSVGGTNGTDGFGLAAGKNGSKSFMSQLAGGVVADLRISGNLLIIWVIVLISFSSVTMSARVMAPSKLATLQVWREPGP